MQPVLFGKFHIVAFILSVVTAIPAAFAFRKAKRIMRCTETYFSPARVFLMISRIVSSGNDPLTYPNTFPSLSIMNVVG